MELSGMMKLRLAVTFLFLLIFLSFFLSIAVINIEDDAYEKFYNSLSRDEIEKWEELWERVFVSSEWEELEEFEEEIYKNYPETDTDNLVELSGFLMWFVIGGLFILMIKVWKTKQIGSNGGYNTIEHSYNQIETKEPTFKTTEEDDEERQKLRREMT